MGVRMCSVFGGFRDQESLLRPNPSGSCVRVQLPSFSQLGVRVEGVEGLGNFASHRLGLGAVRFGVWASSCWERSV